jgi:hypothetical protein
MSITIGNQALVKIGNAVSLNINSEYIQTISQINKGSLYFLGTTTSRIVTSGSSDSTYQFGTGSFTIEWWQNLSAGAASFPRVFEQSSGLMVSIEGSSASRTFYFWTPSLNTVGTITSSLNDTWNHFAIVRSGSSAGNVKVYRNGTQFGSALTITTNLAGTNPINVGNRTTGNLVTEAFSGSITNFHWLNGVAKYTASFTPTGPLTPISGSSALLLLASTSASAYSDSSGYNRTMIATSASWTGSSPF